jgi:enoyl-CoA hydratase
MYRLGGSDDGGRCHVDGLELEDHGVTGTVALSRPPVNALDAATLEALAELFAAPRRWFPDARALVLRGNGPHFSAGHDRAEAELRHDAAFLDRAVTWLATVHLSPLPVIAAVHGAAVGTGAILAFGADLIVADGDAHIALPEVSLGMLGGAGHAARWLPTAWARRLVLTGEPITGAELASVGAVLPPDPGADAAATALRIAAMLARQPGEAVGAARAILAELEADTVATHRRELNRSSGFSTALTAGPDATVR